MQFQKKLLLVELNWMNDDAQQEVSIMFTVKFVVFGELNCFAHKFLECTI